MSASTMHSRVAFRGLAYSAAGDALDFLGDLGLDDARQVLVEPRPQSGRSSSRTTSSSVWPPGGMAMASESWPKAAAAAEAIGSQTSRSSSRAAPAAGFGAGGGGSGSGSGLASV